MTHELAFYQAGNLSIIDICDNRTLKSKCFNKTLADVKTKHPKAVVVPFDWAIEQINEAAKVKYKLLIAEETTEENFFEMLECLPPQDWQTTKEGESFKMLERTFGDITACYVKKNSKYYEVMARTKTSHEKLLSVCN